MGDDSTAFQDETQMQDWHISQTASYLVHLHPSVSMQWHYLGKNRSVPASLA